MSFPRLLLGPATRVWEKMRSDARRDLRTGKQTRRLYISQQEKLFFFSLAIAYAKAIEYQGNPTSH